MTAAARDSSLRRRVPTAMVYGLVVLAAVHYGEVVFLPALAVAAVLAYYELWRLFSRTAYAPSLPFGVVLVMAFLIVHVVWSRVRMSGLDITFEAGVFFSVVVGSIIGLAIIVGGSLAILRKDLANGLLSAGFTILGSIYVGWLLGYLVDIASFGVIAAGPHVDPESLEGYLLQRSGLILVFLTTWANDIAAYAAGSAFGRHKLLPHVSPGKSVEGVAAGMVASVVVATGLVSLFDFGAWVGVAIGVIVGVVGPLGDLVESALKRVAAAKDSGGLLPGHGGMLDRLDSLLFVAPAVALFFELALRFS